MQPVHGARLGVYVAPIIAHQVNPIKFGRGKTPMKTQRRIRREDDW